MINTDIDKGGQTVCGPLWVSSVIGGTNCSGALHVWSLVSGTGTVVTTRNGGADAYLEATGPVNSTAVFHRTTTVNGVPCVSANVTLKVCTASCPLGIIQLSTQGCPKAFAGIPLRLGVGGITAADYTFSWSPAGLVDNPTASVVNIISNSPATITVTATNKYDASICNSSITINDPAWTLPVATISDKNTCPGVGVQIGTAAVGYTYAWSPITNLDNAAIGNPTATVNTSTGYNVVITDAVTGCKINPSMLVNVSAIAYDAGPDRGVCNNATVTLGTTPGGSYTYAWTPIGSNWQGGTGPNDANPQVLFAGAVPQTFNVVVTDPVTGCQLNDAVTLSNTLTPGTYAGVAPAPFCPGGTAQLGTAAILGVTYSWDNAATLSNAAISNPIATPAANPTIYTETISYPGCNLSDNVTVNLLSNPPFDFTDKIICPGTPTNIGVGGAGNPASITNAVSYQWSPASGLSCTACASPNANPLSATTYTCTITFANGCTLSDNVTVTPPFTVSAKPLVVGCGVPPIVLGSIDPGNVSYAWTVVSGTAGSATPTNVAQPTANPSATSVYHMVATGTGPNAGCTITDDIQVNVPLAFTITGSTIVCAGGSTTLGVTPVTNNIYQWAPVTGVANPTSSQTVITPPATGTYKLVQTDLSTGCSSSQQVLLVVTPNPITANGGTVSVCTNPGTALPLNITSAGSYTYSWASTAFLSNPFTQNPITYANVSTPYTATITDNTSNCQLQVQSNIIVGVCAVNLSGKVFHDANGQTDGNVNASGPLTTIPAGLYASLVDGSNNILSTVPVSTVDGSYTFPLVPAGTYSIVLSTNSAGSVVPILPSGWSGTGAILGAGPGGTASTGILSSVPVSTSDLGNANLAIQQVPLPDAQTYTISQPAYTSVQYLNGTGGAGSPGALSGTDPEDGIKGTGATFTVTDISGMNGNQLLYNGVAVVAGAPINIYNPALLSVLYNGLGSTNFTFSYSVSDAAGIAGPPVNYSVSWGIILPLNLLSFTATKNTEHSALLQWTTATEKNTKEIIAERSKDGINWKAIGSVKAAGNSAAQTSYSLTDNYPQDGINFYRLRLIEMNGDYRVSPVRKLMFGSDSNILTVAPNPTEGNTTLRFSQPLAGNTTIRLLNSDGQLIRKEVLNSGINTYNLDVSNVAKGTYLIIAEGKSIHQQVKVVVSR